MCYCHNGCCCRFRVRYPIITIFLLILFSIIFFPLWYVGYLPGRLWNARSVETTGDILNTNLATNSYQSCGCGGGSCAGKKRAIEEMSFAEFSEFAENYDFT